MSVGTSLCRTVGYAHKRWRRWRCSPQTPVSSFVFEKRRVRAQIPRSAGLNAHPESDEAPRSIVLRSLEERKSRSSVRDIFVENWHRLEFRRFASSTRHRNGRKLSGDPEGLKIVFNAKIRCSPSPFSISGGLQWAVYNRLGQQSANSSELPTPRKKHQGQAQVEALRSVRDSKRPQDHQDTHSRLRGGGEPSAKRNHVSSEERGLLRRVWEKQKHLSPAQAADTAYFLALRPHPPEALLQQLMAFVLNRNPESSLSTLGLHRLLRVFHLVPGVAERCMLNRLCLALGRRVSLMKPADLQLILADLAAIYTPQFLPLFASAGRALRRSHSALEVSTKTLSAVEGERSSADGPEGHFQGKLSSGSSTEIRESLSPLQAAFLLHSYGRTDYRDSKLFSTFLEIVDAGARQLVHAQRQMTPQWGDRTKVHSTGENQQNYSNLDANEQLNGEALVMCIKGLANVNHRPSKSQCSRFVELLTPYLLNEEPSVLGHATATQRLRLLFGTISGLTRLGAGPQELHRLIEEACSQPLDTLGPYEPCDLLITALALQRATAPTSEFAAAAAGSLEEHLDQQSGSDTKSVSDSSPATDEVVAHCGERLGGPDEDPRRAFSGDCLSSSHFRHAAHCYDSAVGLALTALRSSFFSLHPAFRVSTLAALVSLDAVLSPADRPPRKIIMRREPNELQQFANPILPSRAPASASSTPKDATALTGHSPEKPSVQDGSLRSSLSGLLSQASGKVSGPPLNQLVRTALLSVFYRLPCVSLRLLVDLLESLQACDFCRREREERLCPHDKSQRWHRPLMAALAREGVRKMKHGTPDSVARFLVLFFVELNGYSVSVDPLIYGLHRLGSMGPKEYPHREALRALLLDAGARPEGAAALRCLPAPGARVVKQILGPSASMWKAAVAYTRH